MIDLATSVGLTLTGLSLLVSGALLVRRGSRLSGGLLAGGGLALVAGALLLNLGGRALGTLGLVAAAHLVLPLALAGYPRLSRRHPVDFVALTTLGAAGVLALVQPGSVDVLGSMGLVSAGVLVAYTWWRIERGPDRGALTWMALATAIPGLVVGVVAFATALATGWGLSLGLFAALGPAMVLGVTRPALVDVRGLVVHSVVFAVAAIVYLAAFVGLAALLELLTDRPAPLGLLAVTGVLVATTFHPLRVVLRGVVDELLFGHRPDPLDAAAQAVAHIVDDPVVALHAIREALVLPYAALTVDGTEVAVSGTRVPHTHTQPIELGRDRVARLTVGLRAGDLTWGSQDEHVLRLVAPLLGQTLRARALAADLQSSRQDTVTAREEERRRVRNDLHDELGPRLSGIAFTTDAARNSLRSDPDAADALLRSLRAETVTAIEEIRRIAYGMRPPALDELGLVAALRQQASVLRTPQGAPLLTTITHTGLPASLPAAVEVAAYRIVVEALTNAARHSGGSAATVDLSLRGGALVIDVTDDGASHGRWSAGVGLASMRERAAELGGRLGTHSNGPGGRVRAELPLREGSG